MLGRWEHDGQTVRWTVTGPPWGCLRPARGGVLPLALPSPSPWPTPAKSPRRPRKSPGPLTIYPRQSHRAQYHAGHTVCRDRPRAVRPCPDARSGTFPGKRAYPGRPLPLNIHCEVISLSPPPHPGDPSVTSADTDNTHDICLSPDRAGPPCLNPPTPHVHCRP